MWPHELLNPVCRALQLFLQKLNEENCELWLEIGLDEVGTGGTSQSAWEQNQMPQVLMFPAIKNSTSSKLVSLVVQLEQKCLQCWGRMTPHTLPLFCG